MNHETLQQLVCDRRQERQRDAEAERLAVHAYRRRSRPSERAPVAELALLFAARRHATQ